jgi:hypothetical protein
MGGHLPLKGGDWPSPRPSLIAIAEYVASKTAGVISPLKGEMSAHRQKLRRTEGGAKGHRPNHEAGA